MSINYKVVKQVFGFDETKSEKYVIRSVAGQVVDFNQVRKQVCQVTGIHRGTTNLIIDGLLDVIVNNLEMGLSVNLGEFGMMRPGLRAKAQDSEENARAHTIYRKKINFVPGKMLKNFLRDASVTRVSIPDTDYTVPGNGNNGGGGNGGDEGGGFEDPNA